MIELHRTQRPNTYGTRAPVFGYNTLPYFARQNNAKLVEKLKSKISWGKQATLEYSSII